MAKAKETPLESGNVQVRVQHGSEAEVREFDYPLDPIPPGTKDEREAEAARRCGLFGFTQKASFEQIGSVKTIPQLLALALSIVDTREGGWCEVLSDGKVKAAHPRQRARQHGAEWVGNLGSDRQ